MKDKVIKLDDNTLEIIHTIETKITITKDELFKRKADMENLLTYFEK